MRMISCKTGLGRCGRIVRYLRANEEGVRLKWCFLGLVGTADYILGLPHTTKFKQGFIDIVGTTGAATLVPGLNHSQSGLCHSL